jgi:hypothetical protein
MIRPLRRERAARRGHADHAAVEVEQRTAGVARVDRRVRLDDVRIARQVEAALAVRALRHGHDAGGGCEARLEGRSTPAGAATAATTTVLVGAQDPSTHAVVRASLKGLPVRVVEASDAAAAVLIAEREGPEVAVVDTEVAARLHEHEVPVQIVGVGSTPRSALQLVHAVRRAPGRDL